MLLSSCLNINKNNVCNICNELISLEQSNMIFYTKNQFIEILNHAILCDASTTYNGPLPALNLNDYLTGLQPSGNWIDSNSSNNCNSIYNIVGFYIKPYSGPSRQISHGDNLEIPSNSLLRIYAVKSNIGGQITAPPNFTECMCENYAVLYNSAQSVTYDQNDLTININNSNTTPTFYPYELQFLPKIPNAIVGSNNTIRRGVMEDVFENSFISFHDLSQILSQPQLTHIGISGTRISTGNIHITETDDNLYPNKNQDFFTLKFTGFRKITENDGSPKKSGSHVQINITYTDRGIPGSNSSIPAETWATPCPPRWNPQ